MQREHQAQLEKLATQLSGDQSASRIRELERKLALQEQETEDLRVALRSHIITPVSW